VNSSSTGLHRRTMGGPLVECCALVTFPHYEIKEEIIKEAVYTAT